MKELIARMRSAFNKKNERIKELEAELERVKQENSDYTEGAVELSEFVDEIAPVEEQE